MEKTDLKILHSGDLASILGCMIGLKDTVTAITLVALGTSLPDTFASKIAAQNVCLLSLPLFAYFWSFNLKSLSTYFQRTSESFLLVE